MAHKTDEAALLAAMAETLREPERSGALGIIKRAADQPFAAVPGSPSPRGPKAPHVFKALVADAPPCRFGRSIAVASVAAGRPLVMDLPPRRLEDNEDWLLPTEYLRQQLRTPRALFEELAGRKVHAEHHAAQWVSDTWTKTVEPVQDPVVGVRFWTSGLEGAASHALHCLLRDPGLRQRLRLCKECGALLFSSPRSGPITTLCGDCDPAQDAANARKRIKGAIEVAGLRAPSDLVDEIRQRFGDEVGDLRKALVEDRLGDGGNWLLESFERLIRERSDVVPEPIRQERSEVVAADVIRRLKSSPLRSSGEQPAWATDAIELLSLELRPMPSVAEIDHAFQDLLRRLETSDELERARRDALVYVVHARG